MNGVGQKEGGFTLLEVLIAITLLAVGLLAAASMQISAIGGNAAANRTMEATTSAAGLVEELMGLPYNHALLTAGNHDPENDGLDNDGNGTVDDDADDGILGFHRTWEVTDNAPLPDTKTIRTTVSTSEKGVLKTFSFDYIAANNL